MCPGVILQRVQSPSRAPSPKLPRTDLPSDDEVQVVTEWLVAEEGQSALMQGASPPLHVPVIQRPADARMLQDRDKVRVWEACWPKPLAFFILCECKHQSRTLLSLRRGCLGVGSLQLLPGLRQLIRRQPRQQQTPPAQEQREPADQTVARWR